MLDYLAGTTRLLSLKQDMHKLAAKLQELPTCPQKSTRHCLGIEHGSGRLATGFIVSFTASIHNWSRSTSAGQDPAAPSPTEAATNTKHTSDLLRRFKELTVKEPKDPAGLDQPEIDLRVSTSTHPAAALATRAVT